MAVNKVLPIGTRVVFDKNDGPFHKGEVGTVLFTEDESDGLTHLIATCECTHWAWDSCISEVNEVKETTELTFSTEKHFLPITFAEIIAGIAKGKYKEGQRFKTNAYKGTDYMLYAVITGKGLVGEHHLRWEDTGNPVMVSHSIATDPWFIETEVTAESAQLGLVEEYTDTSIIVELFDDGSALLEISEGGDEVAIGLTVSQVEKLQYFLLTGNTERV